MRYVDMFMKLKTAPELLELKMFPNVKEITESLGAYYACKTVVPFMLSDKNVFCYVVGDGHTPRTAAIFARMTAWNVFSIDPALRLKDYKTQRLTLLKNHMQDIKLKAPYEKAVIIAVHSHASPFDTVKNIQAKLKYFVNIPCCVPTFESKNNLIKQFKDESILSPKNEIFIYNFSKYGIKHES